MLSIRIFKSSLCIVDSRIHLFITILFSVCLLLLFNVIFVIAVGVIASVELLVRLVVVVIITVSWIIIVIGIIVTIIFDSRILDNVIIVVNINISSLIAIVFVAVNFAFVFLVDNWFSGHLRFIVLKKLQVLFVFREIRIIGKRIFDNLCCNRFFVWPLDLLLRLSNIWIIDIMHLSFEALLIILNNLVPFFTQLD